MNLAFIRKYVPSQNPCGIAAFVLVAGMAIASPGLQSRRVSGGTGTITGVCSLPDSSRWDGITVIVGGQNKSATTDSAGRFVISGASAGSIHIQAGKLFYGNARKDTVLPAGDTVDVTLLLSSVIADTSAALTTPEFTTVSTNVGNIGAPNRFVDVGDSGFTWTGQQQLKEASLMIGIDTTRVSDAARFIFGLAQDNLDQDFQSRSDIVVLNASSDSTVHLTAFDDSRANAPPGNPSQPLNILVTQTTSSFGATGDNGYLLVGLTIQNMGYFPLNNLLVGWFVDWNAGASATTNRGRVIFVNQQIAGVNNSLPFPIEIAYQQQSTTTGPCMGIIPLSQPQFRASRIASVQNEIARTSSNRGLTEANKYLYLHDRRKTNSYSDFGVEEDLCTIASVGGRQTDDYSSSIFTLAPGSTLHVGFAFVGGTDSAGMVQNALSAQKKWVQEGNAMDAVPTTWEVYSGWNMISLPVFVQDSVKSHVFPAALSRAFSYAPSVGYTNQDTLATGAGYWLKFPGSGLVDVPGTMRYIDTLNVVRGWNMIGTISYPVPVSTIRTIPTAIIQSNFYGFDRGYEIADTLQPMHAYWIKVSQSGKIILTKPSY